MQLVSIAIPAPIHSSFTYAAGDGVHPSAGSRVVVPFGRRKVVGICLGLIGNAPKKLDGKEIKFIDEILDETPIISAHLMKLLRWMSDYYCAPIGEVARLFLPSRLMNLKAPKTTRPTAPIEIEPFPQGPVRLTDDQQKAFDSILAAVNEPRPETFLLHGVTGSGKTEVYFRIFEELAARGRQGLLLVPEIGLTPQLCGRATSRFGNRIALYHSGLTDAQRHDQWMRMQKGEVDLVIGARSALFAPLPSLGMIVVDEEHDGSYKQDDGVMYNGRDAAVMRAHIEGIPIILGSATPSLESLANVKRGKYKYHSLPTRPGGSLMPDVDIIDMRNLKKHGLKGEMSEGAKKRREFTALSPALYDAIAETLEKKEQVLLYIGRRGFAGAMQCESCGEVMRCPNCDIALVPHHGKFTGRDSHAESKAPSSGVLACHYCSYRIKIPEGCPSCNAGELTPIGHGTERLEAELGDFFPDARVARFDSDTASQPASRRKILNDMRRGKIDILVGTQMVTKGHDFPSITLVGVVAADAALNIPDFRSAERTFQLLTQVGGRAGRGESPGRVIIQTREPAHISFTSAKDHDIDSFAENELTHRKELFYPPFSRLANLRLSAIREETVAKAAAAAAKALQNARSRSAKKSETMILGPAPSPLLKLRGRYRWQILIKAQSPAILAELISSARPAIEAAIPSGVRFSIDVDPINLL